jgi:hypothetical protein
VTHSSPVKIASRGGDGGERPHTCRSLHPSGTDVLAEAGLNTQPKRKQAKHNGT